MMTETYDDFILISPEAKKVWESMSHDQVNAICALVVDSIIETQERILNELESKVNDE